MERCLRIFSRSRKLFLPVFSRRNICTTRILAGGHWNKDWKPGPYPQTQEEREAAAKKYGLRLEDYEPYPDDGTGYGDYPKLPIVSGDSKDPFGDYDVIELKRNFGEPLHVDADMIGEDRLDLTTRPRYSDNVAMLCFFGVVSGFVLLTYLCEPYPYLNSSMPKQFPFNDLYIEKGGDPSNIPVVKHYTFEPAD